MPPPNPAGTTGWDSAAAAHQKPPVYAGRGRVARRRGGGRATYAPDRTIRVHVRQRRRASRLSFGCYL